MEFSELIKTRYSVREYKTDPIPDEVLGKVLDAARLAPTAANRQAFQIIVIHTDRAADKLLEIYGQKWFVQPPLVICACGVPSDNWVRSDARNYVDVDVAIVMDHLILAAANEGLGTCWIGAFDPSAARRVLGLPNDIEPLAFTPLGYPAGQPREKKRKTIGDLVRYEKW